MTERERIEMDEARLKELADIWGGDFRRWPTAEAAAAKVWVAANPGRAERVLFSARQLDAALDASPMPAISTALRDRVIASATGAGLKARTGGARWRRLVWLGGAGWAAAACAGVVFGTTLSGHLQADRQTDLVLEQALVDVFDDTAVLG